MNIDTNPKSEMKIDMNSKSETWLPNTYWMPPINNNWSSNDFYQLIVREENF